jgi:hypothetical protein
MVMESFFIMILIAEIIGLWANPHKLCASPGLRRKPYGRRNRTAQELVLISGFTAFSVVRS